MHSSLSLAVFALALGASADWIDNYKFGNMFYSGPTSDGVYITKATYSLVPPDVPCGYHTGTSDQEELAIWIGVQENPAGKDVLQMSFVQPLLNWAPNQQLTGCDSDNKHWCVAASTYFPSGQSAQTYQQVPTSKQLDFEVSINSETTKIDQKVWVDGSLITSQSDNAGLKPAVFYSGNECYLYDCGTLKGYSWSNITLHLSAADKNFGNTLTLTNATSDGFTTSDGGKTWHNTGVQINKDYFYMDGSVKECSS